MPEWRRESRFYRVRPSAGWWVALLVVPLLLAVIGWGSSGREVAGQAVPSANPPASAAGAPVPSNPAPPTQLPSGPAAAPPPGSNLPFGPFSIVRSADGFVIGGAMPDEGQKSSLIEAIRMAMPGAVVGDDLGVDAGVRVPDVALLAGVFSVTANIADFSVKVDRGVLTLTGTAPSEKERAAVESAATEAWPGLPVVNDLRVE